MTDNLDAVADPPYYAFSATLRVHGEKLPFAEIGETLGVAASHQHHEGHQRRLRTEAWTDDAWHYSAQVPEEASLTEHLRALWKVVQPQVSYLNGLNAKVDVFCGYRSNVDHAGFVVEPDALAIFGALNTPLHVSVIVIE